MTALAGWASYGYCASHPRRFWGLRLHLVTTVHGLPVAFALANPISGDFIRMTNRDWQFSTDEVRRTLGLTTLLIVNDFTALAMALPGFKPEDLLQIGGGKPQPHAVAGVLGPGTGLGGRNSGSTRVGI